MLKPPMRPLFGRVVLNDTPAPPGVGPTAAAESLQRAGVEVSWVSETGDADDVSLHVALTKALDD